MNRVLIVAVIVGVAGLELAFPIAESNAHDYQETLLQPDHVSALHSAGADSNGLARDLPTTLVDRIAAMLH
jgi:hypothetical protein